MNFIISTQYQPVKASDEVYDPGTETTTIYYYVKYFGIFYVDGEDIFNEGDDDGDVETHRYYTLLWEVKQDDMGWYMDTYQATNDSDIAYSAVTITSPNTNSGLGRGLILMGYKVNEEDPVWFEHKLDEYRHKSYAQRIGGSYIYDPSDNQYASSDDKITISQYNPTLIYDIDSD